MTVWRSYFPIWRSVKWKLAKHRAPHQKNTYACAPGYETMTWMRSRLGYLTVNVNSLDNSVLSDIIIASWEIISAHSCSARIVSPQATMGVDLVIATWFYTAAKSRSWEMRNAHCCCCFMLLVRIVYIWRELEAGTSRVYIRIFNTRQWSSFGV